MPELRAAFDRWMRASQGRAAKPGEYLEEYVTYMYRNLQARHARNIKVTRGAKVSDKRGNEYNIDVFFEFVIADIKHRVAIECKDHRRATTRDEVLAFHAKIVDMPSTIGVFISSAGFQSGAQKYLDDHGIRYLTSATLPAFGEILANTLRGALLPDRDAIGQPFWSLMEAKDGSVTGTWRLIPLQDPTNRRDEVVQAIPLLYSRHAALELESSVGDSSTDCLVVGIEQQALYVLTTLGAQSNLKFAIISPILQEGRRLFQAEVRTAQEIANEYLAGDEL